MTILRWIDRHVTRMECFFLGGGMLVGSLLLFVNVVMRYVFKHAIFWAEEFVRFLMVWMIFMGASQVAMRGGHVAVDIVTRFISKRANVILAVFVNVVAILFCGVLGTFGFKQMMRVKMAAQVSPAMEMPMWIVYLAIPLGFLFVMFRFIKQLVKRVQSIRRPETDAPVVFEITD